MIQQNFVNVRTTSNGDVVGRRGFVKQLVAGSATGVIGLSWRDLLVARAEELRKQGRAMILLWMDGGPSQFETFNPKIGSANQGPTEAIATNVPGVQFAQEWTKTAQVMDKIAMIRSMSSGEADHFRAIKLVRTGYPINPVIPYPTWGSVVARHHHDKTFDLPAFVRVGKPRIKTRDVNSGVLGANFESFKIDTPGELPPDLKPTVSPEVLQRRLALATELDNEFARSGAESAAREKRDVYDRTSRFVLSSLLKTFRLDDEPAKLREAYGSSPFGQGCLLARRLVESGVSFVEVFSSGVQNDQGWDTHKNGVKENAVLASETDAGYAMLLTDLAQRGLLDKTLVVWMGEFGRTPKLKPDGGRDHYAEGWITCFSGAGVKMGQVIGATDADGVKVTERPIKVPDLYVTFCHLLGMTPHDEYTTAQNQPLKLVEGGKLIEELLA